VYFSDLRQCKRWGKDGNLGEEKGREGNFCLSVSMFSVFQLLKRARTRRHSLCDATRTNAQQNQHPKLWSHELKTVPRPQATCATRAVANSIVEENPSLVASAATSALQEQPFLVKSRRAEQLLFCLFGGGVLGKEKVKRRWWS